MEQVQLDPSKLSAADRREVTQFIANEAQKTNIQSTVHHLTEVCWKKCMTGKVTAGGLDRNEETCAQNCVERWMDANLAVLKHLETLRGSQ
ncbi:Mitochondrial import inner membrane translocase subunit tim8 [Emydomyces testavorans]|uniref:Mitochondrial import inner membrane translocase subunit n=1 Tax=Emydomyces testavorans TaxID=2070801 RepID=A0AAF0DF28_9EURO|nr:Mitochondrial import inner membrane translocase subunit tim8 [Emydomyces testavorans]